jgi:hypothetical protein
VSKSKLVAREGKKKTKSGAGREVNELVSELVSFYVLAVGQLEYSSGHSLKLLCMRHVVLAEVRSGKLNGRLREFPHRVMEPAT